MTSAPPEARKPLHGQPQPPQNVSTTNARQGSKALLNYNVLTNSLVILAFIAIGAALAMWWSGGI